MYIPSMMIDEPYHKQISISNKSFIIIYRFLLELSD